MAQAIPRPEREAGKASPPPLPQDVARILRKGIPLLVEMSWPRAIRFALLGFPSLWMVFLTWGVWRGMGASSLLWSVGWAALATLLLFLPYAFFSPLWANTPRLVLQDNHLALWQRNKEIWRVDLDTPFCAALLYREDREDAMLLIQRQPQRDSCLLYGRFRMRHTLPKASIPISPLGFSLAAQAIDHLGAYLLPDRQHEYLPWITQEIFAAKGLRLYDLRLPLADASHALRCESRHLVLMHGSETIHRFPYEGLIVEAYSLLHEEQLPESLLLRFTDEALPPNDPLAETMPPSLWLAIAWPRPLHLDHLPPAHHEDAQHALRLTWLDTLLLLHALHLRAVHSIPFSLFQPLPPA